MVLPHGLLVLLSMAGAVVAVAGLRSASGIVGPAFLALMIAITIHPLLAWLQRHRVPGWLAVVLTMLVAYASLVALAAALVFSVARLATLLPSYQPQFTSLVDQFTRWLGERGVTQEQINAAVSQFDLNTLVGVLQRVVTGATGVVSTQEAHRRAIGELIARDKNHPCVVLWSIANEPESVTPESRAYFEPLAAEARRLDPTRPIGFANVMGSTPDRDVLTDLFDVVMLNRYYGWYASPGDLVTAELALEAEISAWVAAYDKPIIFAEYGADTFPGVHDVVPGPWSEEYQAELLAMFHRVFDRFDAVVGEHVWTFADFATAPGVMRVDGNKKGVFTRERRPKAAANLLRRRWRAAS